MRTPDVGLASVAFAGALCVSCFQPAAKEGLACSSDGLCPEGQKCISDVCLRVEPSTCTPTSCGEDMECGPDGRCYIVDEDDNGMSEDTRSFVGRVMVTGAPQSVRILGTLVSSRVAVTCKTCLSDRDVGDIRFSLPGTGAPSSLDKMVVHPDVDVAALFLASPVSQPSLTLSEEAPDVGSHYEAVIPEDAPDSVRRMRMDVTIDDVTAAAFSFAGSACPSSGGPTFDANGANDILYGIHESTTCGDADSYQDLRIDVLRAWILEQIADSEPESCDSAVDTCTGECDRFVCDDSSGTVQTSCEPDNDQCPNGKSCDPSSHQCVTCDEGDVADCGECGEKTCGSDGEWGACHGKQITLTCGNCGRNYCQLNGDFGGCTAVPSLCASGWTCESSGNNFVCEEPPPPVTCNTAPYDDYCELTGETPPSTVQAGKSWLTGSACQYGGCRSCTCHADGTKSCSPGCFF